MAKSQNKGTGAKVGKNKKFKKRERKNVPFGLVFIQATFNNTIVTITDQQGVRARRSRRSRQRLERLRRRATTVCVRWMCGCQGRVRDVSPRSAHWLQRVSMCGAFGTLRRCRITVAVRRSAAAFEIWFSVVRSQF
jgi:hypothetical protein